MDKELENNVALLLGTPLKTSRPISGGDISRAFLLETATDRLFCKVHAGDEGIKMFKAEANGLKALAKSGIIQTPGVLYCEALNGDAVLILEYVHSKPPSQNEMSAFGESLARLHNLHQENFGWECGNYIGSLPQSNKKHNSWVAFYLNERLLPQFKMAEEKGLLAATEVPAPATLHHVLDELFPDTSPSLLHGDLWSGNYLISNTGHACLVDPAVYHGHSEVDLAMSRLFGGFGKAFYTGYESARTRQDGAVEREQLYQLYYLLVHLNLFGTSYRNSVLEITNRYFKT
jgi:fructosamine-3-kinase